MKGTLGRQGRIIIVDKDKKGGRLLMRNPCRT